MSLMTRTQLAEIRAELGRWNPAKPELILDALKASIRAERVGDRNVRLVLVAVPPIVRRLFDAEAERLMFRSTVARLVVANNRGDDFNLGDLASKLERAGIDLKDDYDEADDLARAMEQESLL